MSFAQLILNLLSVRNVKAVLDNLGDFSIFIENRMTMNFHVPGCTPCDRSGYVRL